MARNVTTVCRSLSDISDYAIPNAGNMLEYPTPLLMFQLIIISLLTKFMEICLRPLGQATIVSQILVGMMFGPSLLGRKKELSQKIFPLNGVLVLEIVAAFGNLFYHFLAAVKTDVVMMVRPAKAAMCIGSCFFITTMLLTPLLAFILKRHMVMEANLKNSIIMMAVSQAFTGFPVVSSLINELKIQNTDIGRLALASAVFADLITIIVAGCTMTFRGSLKSVWPVLSVIALVSFICFIIRPIISWMVIKTREKQFVDQNYFFLIIVFALVLAFLGETMGQHYIVGVLILGLILPDGSHLGVALVSRLDTFVSGFLYPSFITFSGLQTNIFQVTSQGIIATVIIVIFGVVVKLGAVMWPAMNNNVPGPDALVLALILNAKGVVEVSIYNFWRDDKLLDCETFTLCIISVVVTTAIINPLIKFLYHPARQYRAVKRNTIQHSKQETGFQMLVCIHNHENVPTVLNLLEISNATEDSPINFIGMVLVKLEARNNPVLIENDHRQYHGDSETADSVTAISSIVKALRHFREHHGDCITVQSYTSISHFETMHHDICQLALDKKATIVIVPFHKRWAIDGFVESIDRSIQLMNHKVLETAPCSVGILVDRSVLRGSLSVLTSKTLLNVAVLFIGGPDDLESLAYGARMARHGGTVNITVFHFLLFGEENSKNRRRDTDLIFEYRQANMGNERFKYFEEVVRDGADVTACLGRITTGFELILVGRYHQKSALFTGLEDWSECPELGVIGDMLASPDFDSTASVLVVQQQRIGTKERRQPLIYDDDTQDDRRWAVSMQNR